MATEPTVDIEGLLAPIPGEDACGENLRYDPVRDQITKAREEQDKSATDGGAEIRADWPLVIRLASETLRSRSKDLMLAGFLTEALSEQHGFAGLRDGLRVMNGLLEQHWDGVYPRIGEDGDLGLRLSPLAWMVQADRGSRLPSRIRSLPLLPSPEDEKRISQTLFAGSYAPPRGANEEESTYQARLAAAADNERLFKQAELAAGFERVAQTFEDAKACQEEALRFDRLLDERFGREAPGTSALREAIDDCVKLIERVYTAKAPADVTGASTPGAAASGAAAAVSGPVGSREDALRRLTEVAAFFRQTEPHSPVSYLVERAVSWGRLPLEQLLEELIKDSSARDQVGDLLGLKRSE